MNERSEITQLPTDENLQRIRELINAGSSNVEHGLIRAKTLEEHAADIRESLAKGAVSEDGKIDLWGVYLKDTGIVVCHTGNGPTSEANARLIEFLLNNAHFMLDELERLYARDGIHETNLQRLEKFAKDHSNE